MLYIGNVGVYISIKNIYIATQEYNYTIKHVKIH